MQARGKRWARAGSLASTPRLRDVLLLAGFLSSGAAALGLELIWVRVLGLAFGSESFGMLGVLAAFFAGLALGSAVLHRFVLRSRRPVLVYVAAECIIAAYALAGPMFMLRLADAVPRWIGPLVGDNRSLAALSLNLTIAMLVLLPATVCMGATTVAVVEAWRRRRTRAENETTVAWLYAVNTLGATIGIALSTYWLLPALGVQAASGVLAGFSLSAAALAWRWSARAVGSEDGAGERYAGASAPSGGRPVAAPVATTASSPSLLYALLFFTGLAGIGLEAVGTHVLAQIFENTVHSFANILAVYLLGTALGAWLYALEPARRFTGDRDRCTRLLLYGLAIAGVVAAAVLAQAAATMSSLAPVGSSYARRVVAETAVTALVFLPPTVFMGATFSHLLGHFTYHGVGYASAFNTLGGTVAPFVFGLVLIPSAGYGAGFYGAVGIYLVLFLAAHLWHRQPARWAVGGAGIAVAALALTSSSLVLVKFPSDVRLLAQRVGLHGVVSVTETPASSAPGPPPARVLLLNQNYGMGGSPGFVAKRMGHLPLLVARAPRDVLHLGVGTGITAGTALDYAVERVTAVELVPEIVDVLPWFTEFNNGLQRDPRVALHASDARRFVRATADTYALIVADLYHPSRDGAGSLYTREHFLGIRGRLRDGGVFVQWLALSQLNPQDLKTIVRTYLDVFPDAHSMIGNYSGRARFALLGWAPGRGAGIAGVDVSRVEALLRRPKGPGEVFEGLHDLLAAYMLDAEGLRRYAGPGPLNTEVNQRIVFDAAPAARIEDSADTYRSLASLLPYRRAFPDEFIGTTSPDDLAALRRSVAPYGAAVTHYLTGEILRLGAPPDASSSAALAEYLKAYELDVRFTLAARRLLELAVRHPGTAKEMVDRLWLTHPEQPDIARLRRKLDGVGEPEQVRATVSRFLQTGE